MRSHFPLTAVILIAASASASASVFADDPPPVPLTYAGVKQLLEDSKGFQPRLKPADPKEAGVNRSLLPQELRGGYFFRDDRTVSIEFSALRDPNAQAPAGAPETAKSPSASTPT